MNIQQFVEELTPYQYISFDVFDTLLFRSVPHFTDIFDIVEKEYEYKYKCKIKNFKAARMYAERVARQERFGKEVNMNLIYSYLPYDELTCRKLRLIEESCEIRNCISNRPMVEVVKYCRDLGKTIIITTDMYLPRYVLEKILEKIGVKYDHMIISGEEGVTKRSGLLFSIVLEKFGIEASQLVHIGDDSNNDIVQPQKYGIKAINRIQNVINKLPYQCEKDKNSITAKHLNSFLERATQNNDFSSEFIIGYTILGPFLWDVCRWIHQLRIDRKLEKLFFVAREGYLVKKCYEMMFPEEKNTLFYVRLNKNLLRFPLLNHGDKVERFIRTIPERCQMHWIEILNYLGVADYDAFLNKLKSHYPNFDFDSNVMFYDLKNNDAVHNILYDAISMQGDLISEQYDLFNEYLENLNFVNSKIGLINNSIHGSGQSLIEDYMRERDLIPNIFGIQFIRSNKCIKLLREQSVGWINCHRKPSLNTSRFVSTSLFFEHLMFEPRGTALRFWKNERGQVDAICETPRMEAYDFEKIASVQNYAVQFISEYSNNISLDLQGIGYDRYVLMLLRPNKEEAKFLCTIWDDDIEKDCQLTNLNLEFNKCFCLLRGLPRNLNWLEGFLAAKDVANKYKKIAYLRVLISYYRHHLPFGDVDYC